MQTQQNEPAEPSQTGVAFFVGLVVTMLAALPALYGLVVALQDAFAEGVVQVGGIGRNSPRQWVPWPQAWAHLLGLSLLVAGGLPLLLALASPGFRRAFGMRNLVLVAFAASIAAPIGISLWLLSGVLTTRSGVVFVIGSFACMGSTLFIGKRFGRVAATLWLLAGVAAALYFRSSKV